MRNGQRWDPESTDAVREFEAALPILVHSQASRRLVFVQQNNRALKTSALQLSRILEKESAYTRVVLSRVQL